MVLILKWYLARWVWYVGQGWGGPTLDSVHAKCTWIISVQVPLGSKRAPYRKGPSALNTSKTKIFTGGTATQRRACNSEKKIVPSLQIGGD